MGTVTTGNETRKVFLAGNEITRWVLDLPTLPNQKPEWGQIPSLPQLSIAVRSDDRAFDVVHPASFLYQKRLDTLTMRVEQFDQVIWSGFLLNVNVDLKAKRTTLVGESILQQKINRSARIDSTFLTPAEAARRLLLLHNVPVDTTSFGKADSILDDIPCRVRVNPSILEWLGTLGDLLLLLASAGIGRFYLLGSGAIGFDSYRLDETPTIAATIDDDDIMQWPTISEDAMEPMNGFTVNHAFGGVSSAGNESISTRDFTAEHAVTMYDDASALYTGSQWVELSNRVYNRLDIAIRKTFGLFLTLQSFIRINSTALAIDRSAEIIGIDDGDKRWTKLTLRIDKGVA